MTTDRKRNQYYIWKSSKPSLLPSGGLWGGRHVSAHSVQSHGDVMAISIAIDIAVAIAIAVIIVSVDFNT